MRGGQRHGVAFDSSEQAFERRTLIALNLAADEVLRLDEIRALIDRTDARIAIDLRGFAIVDEAQAAMHLHTER